MLPRLESLEKERQIQESREKERARRERKDGPSNSMATALQYIDLFGLYCVFVIMNHASPWQ